MDEAKTKEAEVIPVDGEPIRIEHVEVVAPRLPQQTGPVEIVACPADLAGKSCSICSDEPNTKALVEGEQIATVPTDQGVLVQHGICHFAMRCLNLENLLAQYVHALEDAQKSQRATHQMTCAIIAKTGRVRLYQSNFERAMAAAYKLDIVSNEADQSTMISLKGASHIQVVKEMPKG